ncbi:hypothetical protein HBI11_095180 [Parastagonospora nodorum]|nr:hypothetical protein HBI11_095180 [Parastagonospora nodorum]
MLIILYKLPRLTLLAALGVLVGVIRNNHASIRDNNVIQYSLEVLQTSHRLIVRHLMSSLVDPGETKVAVLANLAVLDAINEEGRVASGPERSGIAEVGSERDGLPAKPIVGQSKL